MLRAGKTVNVGAVRLKQQAELLKHSTELRAWDVFVGSSNTFQVTHHHLIYYSFNILIGERKSNIARAVSTAWLEAAQEEGLTFTRLTDTSRPLCRGFVDDDNRTLCYTTHKESPGRTWITCEGGQVILVALLFRCVTNSSVLVGTTVIWISNNDKPSGTGRTFSPLPLGFFARSRPAASAGSSAAVPVSGSPAGRNLSHVPGPQLVPVRGGKQTHTGDNWFPENWIVIKVDSPLM